jgi:hypothetical protein
MNIDEPLPPAGPRLSFTEWTRHVVHAVRRRLNDGIKVTAVDGVIVLRRGTRTATISEEGPSRVVTLADATRNRGGAESVTDQARGDAFSAAVAAAAIAAYFD